MPNEQERIQRLLIARIEEALVKLRASREKLEAMRDDKADQEAGDYITKMIAHTDLADKVLRKALVKVKGALNPRVTGSYVIDWKKLSEDIEGYRE